MGDKFCKEFFLLKKKTTNTEQNKTKKNTTQNNTEQIELVKIIQNLQPSNHFAYLKGRRISKSHL